MISTTWYDCMKLLMYAFYGWMQVGKGCVVNAGTRDGWFVDFECQLTSALCTVLALRLAEFGFIDIVKC